MTDTSRAIKAIPKIEREPNPDSFISRATKVLGCLSEDIHSLSDIAKHCHLGASSTHRLLATLVKPGLVIYDHNSHRYYLGPKVAELSTNPVTSHQVLIMTANHEMERLANVVEETITLCLMLGVQFIPLHSVYSKRRLIVLEDYHGTRPVVPQGSTDLVLLSQLKDKRLRQALELGHFWEGSNEPISSLDMERQMKQLTRVRKEGYSVTRGEKVTGGLGISAAVTNYFCPVALTVIGPEYRLETSLDNLIKEITQSAHLISELLLKIFGMPDFQSDQNIAEE